MTDIKELIAGTIVPMASDLGVDIELTEDDETSGIWISSIERISGNKGSGREVLEQLLEDAAQHEITVRGAVTPPNDQLENYYQDIGFELQSENSRTIIIK